MDYLLDMDAWQKDTRRAECDETFKNYWKEDKEKNYPVALRTVKEYPGDMEYLLWLASAGMPKKYKIILACLRTM